MPPLALPRGAVIGWVLRTFAACFLHDSQARSTSVAGVPAQPTCICVSIMRAARRTSQKMGWRARGRAAQGP
eukprot:14786383-Alexandrium_andersonii.AAC.1